jgi:hypothetical protein
VATSVIIIFSSTHLKRQLQPAASTAFKAPPWEPNMGLGLSAGPQSENQPREQQQQKQQQGNIRA